MSENEIQANRSIIPTALRYALIGVLLAALYSMILYIIGQQYNLWLSFAALVIPILIIAFGIRSYKRENDNYLKFTTGLWVGLLIALIYGIGAFLFTEIYTTWIIDNYWDGLADSMEEMFENFGMSDEQIESQLARLENRRSLGKKISDTALSIGIVGLIISVISSSILKTSKEENTI